MPDVNMTIRSFRQVSPKTQKGHGYLKVVAEMNREDMKSVLRGIQKVVTGSEWDAMLKEVDEEE